MHLHKFWDAEERIDDIKDGTIKWLIHKGREKKRDKLTEPQRRLELYEENQHRCKYCLTLKRETEKDQNNFWDTKTEQLLKFHVKNIYRPMHRKLFMKKWSSAINYAASIK